MSKILIGNVDEFNNLECKPVQVGRKKVLVWRSNEKFYGTQDKCPHQGASLECEVLTGTMMPTKPKSLEYGLDGLVVRCPWHKWEYDVATGDSVFETENGCLKTYNISVEDEKVYIEL